MTGVAMIHAMRSGHRMAAVIPPPLGLPGPTRHSRL